MGQTRLSKHAQLVLEPLGEQNLGGATKTPTRFTAEKWNCPLPAEDQNDSHPPAKTGRKPASARIFATSWRLSP
jgi:hypothetical protein